MSIAVVIEDERQHHKLIEIILSSAGYTDITIVDNPQDGRTKIQEKSPALILSDNDCPDLGAGIILMEDIKRGAVPGSEKSARVLMSGGNVTAAEALNAGADAFVAKPYGSTLLIAAVKIAEQKASGRGTGTGAGGGGVTGAQSQGTVQQDPPQKDTGTP